MLLLIFKDYSKGFSLNPLIRAAKFLPLQEFLEKKKTKIFPTEFGFLLSN
jgi:hypothetical protein